MSSRRLMVGISLLTLTFVPCAGAEESWLGNYSAISRVCYGSPLVVDEAEFTWLECENVPVTKLLETEREYALLIDKEAKCNWAGLTVVLRKLDGILAEITTGGVSIAVYPNLEAYRAQPTQWFCAYERKRQSPTDYYSDY